MTQPPPDGTTEPVQPDSTAAARSAADPTALGHGPVPYPPPPASFPPQPSPYAPAPPHSGATQQPPYSGAAQPPYSGPPHSGAAPQPYSGAPGQPYPAAPPQPYSGGPSQPYSGAAQPPYSGAPQPYTGAPGQAYSYAPYAAPVNKTNTLAIVALVLALLVPVAGVVCAHLARKQIRETGQDGDGIALAAMIIGYAYLALAVLACCGVGIFAITTGTNT